MDVLMLIGMVSLFGGMIGLYRPSWVKLTSRWQAAFLLFFSVIPATASGEFFPTKDAHQEAGSTLFTILSVAGWSAVIIFIRIALRASALKKGAPPSPSGGFVEKMAQKWSAAIPVVPAKSDATPATIAPAPQKRRSANDQEQRRRAGEDFIKGLGERRGIAPVRPATVDLGAIQVAARDMKVTPRIPAKRKPKVEAVVSDPVDARVRDHSSGWAGYISYVDAKGVSSERRIVVKRIEGYGKAESIQAYCCEREASRRFLISGIQELACAETGEMLDPQTHFDLLASEGAIGIADKSLADLIIILVFLARCDGEFHPLEMECLEGAILEHMMSFGGEPKEVRKAARKARQLAPDAVDFTDALHRLSKHPQRNRLAGIILDAAEDVVEADGVVTQQEEEFYDLVFEALDAMASE